MNLIFLNFNCFTVEKYSFIVNGEAKAEIEQYMSEEHTFEEYCDVSTGQCMSRAVKGKAVH